MAATEPIRNKQQLHDMAEYFRSRGEFRNYNLIVLGVYTALRIGDLLRLRWKDVYDEKRQRFHTRITLTEQKTGKYKEIALNEQALEALDKDREFLTRGGVFSNVMIDAYIELKMQEVQRFRMAPHPVEYDMYYSL